MNASANADEDFRRRLDFAAEATEATLITLLAPQRLPDEIARPSRLLEAMRYASLGGGKRLRPFLVIETARLLGVEGSGVLRVACALERHRLKHGKYPDTTAALVPEFIDKVPHDVMTGTPLKFRLTPDGRFTLYSIGFDERDDGGTVVLRSSGGSSPPSLDYERGDWVWSYEDKVTGGGKK